MTFPIALLIAGVLLILIGLLGKIIIKEHEFGTDSKPIRVIISLLGAVLLVLAFLIYGWDKPVPPDGNIANTNIQPSPSPSPTPIEVSIKNPSPNDRVNVKVDNGTALIPVTGSLTGLSASESKNTHVYVFTNTGDVPEWWYDKPTDPDQDGEWRTIALAGSSGHPVKDNQVVKIQAVVAKESEIQKATGGKKVVERLNLITARKVSDPVIITLAPKKD